MESTVPYRGTQRATAVMVAMAAALSCAFPRLSHAEVSTPVVEINTEVSIGPVDARPVRGDVSVLIGAGGNIGVLNTADGKLLVDAGIAVSKDKIVAALAGIGPSPVKFVIDTHYHWDHTDGNAWLHERGATIIAHENTLKRLTTGTRVVDWSFRFPASAPDGLPTVTFRDDRTMTFGNETIVMKHYQEGHTDSDITVYFRNADVLQVGDIWWNGFYPFIDYTAGGSIDGVIREVNACIDASTPKTIIIPGHGPVGTRAGLIEFRDMLVAIRANVARLKHQGKTLAETVEAKPTAAYDAKFGQFLIDPAFFTHLVYMGV